MKKSLLFTFAFSLATLLANEAPPQTVPETASTMAPIQACTAFVPKSRDVMVELYGSCDRKVSKWNNLPLLFT